MGKAMRHRHLILSCSFTLVLLLLLTPILSYGQSYRPLRAELDEIARRTLWQKGPFRFYPIIGLRFGYDSNVYYQHEISEPISDYVAVFPAEINAHFIHKNRLILSLAWNPEYVYYLNEERERRWNNAISLKFKLRLLRQLVLSGGYAYSNRRRRPSSEFDVRANEIIRGYHGGLFFESGWKTSLGFIGSIRNISYEDITDPGEEIYLSRDLNREEKNGSLEFYYRILSKGYFFISGGYTEYDFEYVESSWRDSYSYQVYSGIRFPILGKIRGTLSLGYKELVPRSKEKSGFSGIVGNTSLDFRLRRFGFRLNYISDVYFSYWTNSIFFNEDRYGAGASFYPTKFLRVDYNFSYGEARYPEPVLQSMPDGSYEERYRKDIYRTHSAGIVFRIIKNTGIGLTVNWWERQSNFIRENRNWGFVGMYLTYDF
jgi:hypothetical protein